MEIQEVNLRWRSFVFILAVLVLFIFPKTRAFYFKLLDFSVLKRVNTYVIILMALLLIFISNLFIFNRSLSATYNLLTSSYSRTIMLDTYELFLYIFTITILAPILEELLFRAPLSIWANKLPGYLITLLISSVLFGLGHTEYPLFGFILGIVFGLVFRLTNSLIPAILTHFLWNVFTLFYFNHI
ncbi:CPBP family intramembrane metalloprotease [Pradoshia sp. D12]|uniref:CPBP family intramembrane glutamic endopeptidase n=1 Tax=Bacillaceae TaxID=186817 RepID=UPI00112EC9F6|nr:MULTISPECIES: CPBP family intramembrane glutamic endopeptidase [Bacillaceae]QFK72364.1 CPBP family intramembrane metalloprotease [Pradoshia sp. D12]TPF71143.1 CPBP family intramembrane metalloprotease [Bacillus sp. D12]